MGSLGSLDRQIEAAALAGYKNVDPLEYHLSSTERLDRILLEHAVLAPTAHVAFSTITQQSTQTVENCLRYGVRELFVQIPNVQAVEAVAFWQKVGSDLGHIAESLQENGIALGFHNTPSGLRLFSNGRYGLEILFRAASGSPLSWQADIAWLHRAGVNPSDWLRRFSGLLTSAHIKDRAAEGVGEDGWSNVGAGMMIWPSLWHEAIKNGARTLVIEHDRPQDPIAFAKSSLSYVQRPGFSTHTLARGLGTLGSDQDI
jgi:sugar phosphate isomerase/epimerase